MQRLVLKVLILSCVTVQNSENGTLFKLIKKCTTDTVSLRKPVTLLICLQNTNYTLFPAGESFEIFPFLFTTDS